MGLREEAEAVLAETMEDPDMFGWSITLTDPSESSAEMYGLSADISQMIDPDTGEVITGRVASVALRMSSIVAAGFTGFPKNIAETTSKPWLVTFNDILGTEHTFKVRESNRDRAMGVIVCMLEVYRT